MEDAASRLPWMKLDDPDELDAEEPKNLEEQVVDAATAAQTVAELEFEIAQLDKLVDLARSVRDSGEDRKWTELRSATRRRTRARQPPRPLQADHLHRAPRHLNYLTQQIRNVLGRADAVVTIHGGTATRRTPRHPRGLHPRPRRACVGGWPPTLPVKVSTSRPRT